MKNAKNILHSYKTVILGLIFILFVVVMFCGHIQLFSHSTSSSVSAECNKTIFLTGYLSTRNNGILYLLIFSFIALAVLIKGRLDRRRQDTVQDHPQFSFLNIAQFIPKLYNPILKALRRGILHTQIYNFALAIR
ncbi:hypothetical protein IID20_05185 [Patescibacteria group bacterium]|nr:hypothetical protein [Patescibacteria group bacterium]